MERRRAPHSHSRRAHDSLSFKRLTLIQNAATLKEVEKAIAQTERESESEREREKERERESEREKERERERERESINIIINQLRQYGP